MTMTRRAAAILSIVGMAAALGSGTAAAQSTSDVQHAVQPNVGSLQVAGALPGWDVTTGAAHAQAAQDAISLAVSVAGGQATAEAAGSSGPAVIANGQNAVATATGLVPGLALGTASADSTVSIPGSTPATCAGAFAFAGDFQTLTGCLAINGTQYPLGGSVAAPWGVR